MLHARVKWFGSFNKNDTSNAPRFGRSTSCFYTAQKVLLQRMGHQPPWQKQKLGVFRFRWKLGWMSLRITRLHICCVHPPPWFTVDKQVIHFYEGANTNLHELYWHVGWGFAQHICIPAAIVWNTSCGFLIYGEAWEVSTNTQPIRNHKKSGSKWQFLVMCHAVL